MRKSFGFFFCFVFLLSFNLHGQNNYQGIKADTLHDSNDQTASCKGKPGARFFLGSGISLSALNYNQNSLSSSTLSPIKPYFSVGVDLFANRNVQRIVLRSELSLGFAKLGSPAVSQRTTGLSVQPLFNVYNYKDFKFYLSPGIRFNHSIYKEQGFSYTQSSADKAFIIQGGILLQQRIEITWSYSLHLGSSSLDDKVIRLGVNYHFRKRMI